MKTRIACAAFVAAILTATAAASADQRVNAVVTVPTPISSSTSRASGVGLSYSLIKVGPVEIAPFATVANYGTATTALRVRPGLALQVTVFNRVSIGIAETLRPGGRVNADPKQYTPSLILGVRI